MNAFIIMDYLNLQEVLPPNHSKWETNHLNIQQFLLNEPAAQEELDQPLEFDDFQDEHGQPQLMTYGQAIEKYRDHLKEWTEHIQQEFRDGLMNNREISSLSRLINEGLKIQYIILRHQKETAKQALAAAVKSRSIKDLEKAIQQSNDAGLSYTDRDAACKVLLEERLKAAAKQALAAAMESRSIPELEDAIQQSKDTGLSPTDWDAACKVLLEERLIQKKEAAKQALAAAVKSRSIQELEKAIQQSKDAGLSPTDRDAADKALEEEKMKDSKKQATVQKSAVTLADVLQKRGAAKVFWSVADPFYGRNSHNCKEWHPLAAASRDFQVLGKERLYLLEDEEITPDVTNRWQQAQADILWSSENWGRKRYESASSGDAKAIVSLGAVFDPF